MADVIYNGWRVLYLKLFHEILAELESDVKKIQDKATSVEEFKKHPKTKLLASVFTVITKTVPDNPANSVFLLGNTLGTENRSFRRVKKLSLPPRYRLFFKFTSSPQNIIYIWLNNEKTIRKAGSKNDVYAVFKKMIRRGEIPKDISELLAHASSPSN